MDAFSKRIVVTALVASTLLGVLAVARSTTAQTSFIASVRPQTSKSIGSIIRPTSNKPLDRAIAAVGAQFATQAAFDPQPNPEPVNTGGTGTR